MQQHLPCLGLLWMQPEQNGQHRWLDTTQRSGNVSRAARSHCSSKLSEASAKSIQVPSKVDQNHHVSINKETPETSRTSVGNLLVQQQSSNPGHSHICRLPPNILGAWSVKTGGHSMGVSSLQAIKIKSWFFSTA